MTPQEAFVTRLRRHRQRNRISLDEIAADIRIKRPLLEALEGNDLSAWPSGLYARAWIRAYASVVGLDPDDTVDEFCRLFPNGDRRSQPTIEEIAEIVAAVSQYRDDFDPSQNRRGVAEPVNGVPSASKQGAVFSGARDLLADLIRALRVRAASPKQH
jgi:helix-turn-helix protein